MKNPHRRRDQRTAQGRIPIPPFRQPPSRSGAPAPRRRQRTGLPGKTSRRWPRSHHPHDGRKTSNRDSSKLPLVLKGPPLAAPFFFSFFFSPAIGPFTRRMKILPSDSPHITRRTPFLSERAANILRPGPRRSFFTPPAMAQIGAEHHRYPCCLHPIPTQQRSNPNKQPFDYSEPRSPRTWRLFGSRMLKQKGAFRLSVDSFCPEVQRLGAGAVNVDYLNDIQIHGFFCR